MPTSRDLHLTAATAHDSRGRPTVVVEATAQDLYATGDVPAGASKGADEARTVPTDQALEHVLQNILPMLQAANLPLDDAQTLCALDAQMAAGAGQNFADWGANAVLPVSRALWRLGAQARKEPLHAFLRAALRHTPPQAAPVRLFMNIFNGGLHALKKGEGEVLGRDRIGIQEIMVVPVRAQSYHEALAIGDRIDGALEAILGRAYGTQRLSRADEAGFTVHGLGDDATALGHVAQAIEAAGYKPGVDVKLALDVAASSLYDAEAKTYTVAGKVLDAAGMCGYLEQLVDTYPHQFLSIEDGLDENDWSAWHTHSKAMHERSVVTIGDDLFVTQSARLERGIQERSAHAILIKVNQNGTMGGTLGVIDKAHAAGMRCVVSHRSGETLDDSIADLAVAAGALGLKSGDPQPAGAFPDPKTWVRRRKYLRLVEIES